ncbi:hypothetical protein F4776DRAFT_666729 [Hypoxylon sp. NC0597]|nr:hypothetical protein F4776DRAFT_666729 [Hypoxylon sp. NC0597]
MSTVANYDFRARILFWPYFILRYGTISEPRCLASALSAWVAGVTTSAVGASLSGIWTGDDEQPRLEAVRLFRLSAILGWICLSFGLLLTSTRPNKAYMAFDVRIVKAMGVLFGLQIVCLLTGGALFRTIDTSLWSFFSTQITLLGLCAFYFATGWRVHETYDVEDPVANMRVNPEGSGDNGRLLKSLSYSHPEPSIARPEPSLTKNTLRGNQESQFNNYEVRTRQHQRCVSDGGQSSYRIWPS